MHLLFNQVNFTTDLGVLLLSETKTTIFDIIKKERNKTSLFIPKLHLASTSICNHLDPEMFSTETTFDVYQQDVALISKRRKFSTKDCEECKICSDTVFEVLINNFYF